MSDERAARLLHPSRKWPPLSAIAASGSLLLLPLAMCGVVLATGQWAALPIPILLLLATAVSAVGLLLGRPFGVVIGFGVLVLMLLAQAATGALAARNGAGRAVLTGSAIVACWLLTTGFLIWWPATRIWCGRLPADPYGEFDDE